MCRRRPRQRWSYPGNPQFALAEAWLGRPIAAEERSAGLVCRYLAAFGPATVQDMQTWSGFPKLKDAIAEFKADLRIYRDERGRELLDLPDLPLPDPDTPAPVRFLPEYDNLLLSHQNRTRVIPDKYHAHVFLTGLRVAATILVDGFVAGAWKIEKAKGTATLVISRSSRWRKRSATRWPRKANGWCGSLRRTRRHSKSVCG